LKPRPYLMLVAVLSGIIANLTDVPIVLLAVLNSG
jgi:hypothetical protein